MKQNAAVVSALLIVCGLSADAQDRPPVAAEVSVLSITIHDGAPLGDPKAFVVTPRRVSAKRDESLGQLLKSRQIATDAQSMGLIYTWNPGLTADRLMTDGEVWLPSVAATTAATLPTNAIVDLVLEPTRKREMARTSKAIETRFPSIRTHMQSDASVKPTLDRIATSTEGIITAIDANAIPIDGVYLREVDAELNALQKLVNMPSGRLSSSEVLQLRQLADALDLRAADLVEIRGPHETMKRLTTVPVLVQVLDDKQHLLSGFRVRYVPELLWDQREANYQEFGGVTPTAMGYLLQADYWIYADKPSGASAERKRVAVRKSKTNNATLTIQLLLAGQ
jgi:hypothetical protein